MQIPYYCLNIMRSHELDSTIHAGNRKINQEEATAVRAVGVFTFRNYKVPGGLKKHFFPEGQIIN